MTVLKNGPDLEILEIQTLVTGSIISHAYFSLFLDLRWLSRQKYAHNIS